MVKDADKMLNSLLEDNEMDGPVFKINEDPRITKFGRFLSHRIMFLQTRSVTTVILSLRRILTA